MPVVMRKGPAVLVAAACVVAAWAGALQAETCVAFEAKTRTNSIDVTRQLGVIKLELADELEFKGGMMGEIESIVNETTTVLNHTLAFGPAGVIFTQGDQAQIVGQIDACTLAAVEKIHFAGGTGPLGALAQGEGVAEGTLNICTGINRFKVHGRLCGDTSALPALKGTDG